MMNCWKYLSDLDDDDKCSEDLESCQESWLLECLNKNKKSIYGMKYDFSKLKNVKEYQNSVPIVRYSNISQDIQKIAKGENNILFSGKVLAFERTSGSTTLPKLIPYTIESFHDYRRAILPWLVNVIEINKITSGSAYWAISPATRQTELTSSGIPIGLLDGAYLGDDTLPFFVESSAVPQWVSGLVDFNTWQLVTLYYLVVSINLQLISVWSPTFLISLMDAIYERKDELKNILLNGKEINEHSLVQDASASHRLNEYFVSRNIDVLWPELKIISCWTDASSIVFSQQLMNMFPNVKIQSKGLLSTEGVVTVPNKNDKTVLAANSGFYEFINCDGHIYLAQQITPGEKYEIVMTTSGGLYRYRTGDRVECMGFDNGLPILVFLGRDNSSDLVGEKLTEEFVEYSLNELQGFRMLIPVSDGAPGYILITDKEKVNDKDIIKVEQRLSENPQYAYAIKLGQLAPLNVVKISNPLELYLRSMVNKNNRLGDIKVPSLCLKKDVFDYLDVTV